MSSKWSYAFEFVIKLQCEKLAYPQQFEKECLEFLTQKSHTQIFYI